jgi:hypothetical protein
MEQRQGRHRFGWFARKFGVPELVKSIDDFKEELMGAFEDLQAAAARIGPGIDSVATEITKVAGQLASNPTTEQLTELAATLNTQADRLGGLRDSADALAEVPGEDDEAPPPVQ